MIVDRTLHFNVSHHFLTDSTSLDEQKTSTHALASFFFFFYTSKNIIIESISNNIEYNVITERRQLGPSVKSTMEVLPIQSQIYIPENKVSAWVSKKEDGNVITKDKSKEYQGVWVIEGYTLDKKKSSTEVWIFNDDDVLGIDRRVLENNPLQGTWGYAPNVRDVRKVEPHDMWFFPPKSARCKIPVGMQEYNIKGIWVKPTFKRDFSKLESNTTGFMTVSGDMKIAKGERHSVAGKWNMMGFNDDVVRGKKKKKDDDDMNKGPYEIFVRKPSGVRFPIKDVIPANRIYLIKKKIYKEHGIPIEGQRLSFNDVPLKDEKTVVGSGIRNGNTIDLGDMIIYVRNLKGKKYTFKVDPDELVENVKKMVEKREGTPVCEQQLYFNDTKLDDDGKPIIHFNIKHKSILHLDEEPEPPPPKDKRKPQKEKAKSPKRKSPTRKAKYKPDPKASNPPALELPPEPESFEVKTPDGRSFFFDFDPNNDTFDNLKRKIAKTVQLPVKDLQLIDDNDELVDPNSKPVRGAILDVAPQIEVALPDTPKKIKLSLLPRMTIEDLKDVIEEKTGTPKAKQRIFFYDNELDDSTPMKKAGIGQGSVLEVLRPDPPPPENFEVKTPDGRSFFFDFDPNNDTFDNLKRKIAKTVLLPVKDLQLIDDNDELVDPNSKPVRGAIFDVAPQIEVALPDTPKKIKLSMLPKMTIEDLKDVIEEKTGTPKAKQRIFFFDSEGNELDNSTPMKKAGIGQGSVLEVRPDPPESFEVKTPDGRSFFFDFDPNNDTFDNLKRKIAKTVQLPVKDLHLIDSNDELVDVDNSTPVRGAIFDVAPQIEVVLPDKQTKVKLCVLPNMTIEDLKDVVEEKTGTPKAKQRIFFFDNEGNELDDSTPMKKTGIGQGSVLEVRPLESEPKEITIKDSTGRIFKFIIDRDEPMKKLKKRIAKKIGIPLGGFTLNDKDWDDDDEIGSDDAGLARAARNGGVLVLDVPEVENDLPNSEKIDLKILPIRDVKNVEEETDQSMSIRVNLPSKKKPVRFAVKPSDTIRKIKRQALEKIKKKKGESTRDYCLVFGGRELDDGETLEKCKIQHDALLSLEEFKLRIMHWSGEIIDLDGVTRHDTVASLKKQIYRTEGIPLNEQRLSLHGRRLEDKKTMEEVKHKTILVLEPLDADNDVTEAGKKSAKKMKIKKFKSRDYNEIWPVMPDWKRRIFFFDNDDKFDAHIDLFCCIGSTGEKILLDNILPNTKVAEIKSKIYVLKGIKKNKHKLKFDGNLLDEKKTLREQSVGHRSVLVLESPAVFIAAHTLDKLNGIFETLPTKMVQNINITVKHWNGDTFTLNPAPNDYIDDVKDAICEITNIPNEQLRLLFQGRLTCDDMDNLMELDIVEGSVLELEPMRILLKLPTKTKLVSINVELDQTLYDIKKVIAKMTKIALDSLCIMFGGVELDYTKTLSDYSIEHEDTLRIEIFEIKILHWSGEMFTLNSVGPNGTTYDVKDKIADSKSIPPGQQIISLKGQVLNDVLRLKDQGIKHRSVLMLDQQKENRALPVKEKVSLSLFKTSGTAYDGGKVGNDISSTLSIEIKHWNGETFSIDAEPTEYIDDVKERILSSKNISVNRQRLEFEGQLVREDTSLGEQGIIDDSTLSMRKMKVYIDDTISGSRIDVEIEPEDSILQMKKLYQKKTKTLTKSQCIVMDSGEELSDSMTLSHYGIDDGGVLRLELFKVRIVDCNGQLFEVDGIHRDSSVDELKTRIKELKSIPPSEQMLKIDGEILNDMLRLKDQGIKYMSIIVLDLPSGSSHHSLTDKKATTQDSKAAKKKKSDRHDGGSGKRTKSLSSRSKERGSSKEKKKKKKKDKIITEKTSMKKKKNEKDVGSPGTVII